MIIASAAVSLMFLPYRVLGGHYLHQVTKSYNLLATIQHYVLGSTVYNIHNNVVCRTLHCVVQCSVQCTV